MIASRRAEFWVNKIKKERTRESVNLKLAKWRSDLIDGMNNYRIKMVDYTLR